MKKFVLFALPLVYLLFLLFQIDLGMLGDLGRHLKLGEIVLHCHCVPQTNLFSYTNPNFPIVNHEWLAEVLMYCVSAVFGLSGLLVFKMLLLVSAGVLLYKTALKKGSHFWVTVFAMLCLTLFSMRFHTLPELFSYLFISLFVFLLVQYETNKNIKLLWVLPILQLLWVNMHLYFIVGLGIYFFFLLETLVKKQLSKQILFIGIALVLATLINPSGLTGALLPFTFSQNYAFPVEENNSPLQIFQATSTNANTAYTLYLQVWTFFLLCFIFGLSFIFKKQWKQVTHIGNGLIGAILGLRYVRCIPLFGLLGFIPLVESFTNLEMQLKKQIEHTSLQTGKSIILGLVVLVASIHVIGLFQYNILSFSYAPSAEKAVSFIKANAIAGKIFNNYIVGNYLIYGLYPKEKVYVDARPEAYPAGFFADYWRMMADPVFFKEQVKKYAINAVVFNVAADDPVKFRPFLISLLQSPDWVPVYGDGTITIFVRNNEVNKAVIAKYRIIPTR